MSLSELKTRQRWRLSDYQTALIELRSARVEFNQKEYRLFKGLTDKNGFFISKPEKITRRKRETIKKLIADLSVIRSRRMAYLAPRKKKRIYEAKKSSGFRSPFFNVIPLAIIPSLRAEVKWVKDRPVVYYPSVNVASYTAGIQKSGIYKAMKAAARIGDDPGDVIIPEVQKQIKQGDRIIKDIAKPNDLIRYRLRTIYGDIQPGNVYGISDNVEDLAEDLGKWLNKYQPTDEQGNFLVGYTVWLVKREENLPESFKPDYQLVTDKKQGRANAKKSKAKRQSKRAKIKGR